MRLTNIRPVMRGKVQMMVADFMISDGRTGCVEARMDEYEAHGDVVLERLALQVEYGAAADQYRPPSHDRFDELR